MKMLRLAVKTLRPRQDPPPLARPESSPPGSPMDPVYGMQRFVMYDPCHDSHDNRVYETEDRRTFNEDDVESSVQSLCFVHRLNPPRNQRFGIHDTLLNVHKQFELYYEQQQNVDGDIEHHTRARPLTFPPDFKLPVERAFATLCKTRRTTSHICGCWGYVGGTAPCGCTRHSADELEALKTECTHRAV